MRVVLAENAGTCFGVQRALDLAEEVAGRGEPASTLGPIIHNPRVVGELAARGVAPVEEPKDVETHTVVVRSHGVLPEVREALDARGLDVVDATCPYVLRAQRSAERLAREGRLVVVVGEAGHPEVEGLVAWARRGGADVLVVASAAEIPEELPARVGVVVQTTQRKAVLDEVVRAVGERCGDVSVQNTICSATTARQDAAAALAASVDAMVVLGGRNSSNTTRLAEICRAVGAKTFHVESPDELGAADFEGCETVGVTAGASTPQGQIEEIVCALEAI